MFEFAASMFIIGIGVAFAATVALSQPTTISKERQYGRIRPDVECVGCCTSGSVHVRDVWKNGEISTAKLVVGALTCGLGWLAVGMHERRRVTQRHCAACGQTWTE